MRNARRSLCGYARALAHDTRGAAAAEMAIWITVLVPALLSVVDIGFYAYQRLQVELAAQAGAQAVRLACKDASAPVTAHCATLTSAVASAIASTQLNTTVTLASGYPSEGYYCVDGSEKLVRVGTSGTVGAPPTKPAPFTCETVVTGSTSSPGTYVLVAVQHTYTPFFTGVSAAELLPSTITASARLRLE